MKEKYACYTVFIFVWWIATGEKMTDAEAEEMMREADSNHSMSLASFFLVVLCEFVFVG